MAIALVAATSAGSVDGGGSVTTSSIDTTGATLIVIAVSMNVTITDIPTDNKSNTWNGLTTRTSSVRLRLFYAENPTVGTGHTFTFNEPSSFPSIAVLAFSGTLTSGVLDQESGTTSSVADSQMASGSITPTVDNEVIVAAASAFTSNPNAANNGYTFEESVAFSGGNHFNIGAAYLIQGAAALTSTTFTLSANKIDGAGVIASFKPAAGGAATWPGYISPFGWRRNKKYKSLFHDELFREQMKHAPLLKVA